MSDFIFGVDMQFNVFYNKGTSKHEPSPTSSSIIRIFDIMRTKLRSELYG